MTQVVSLIVADFDLVLVILCMLHSLQAQSA